MDSHPYAEHQSAIEAAWQEKDRSLSNGALELVRQTLALLDQGRVRVAEREAPGRWRVNAWVKQAILLYFRYHRNRPFAAGDVKFFDKIPLKGDFERRGVRVVPMAVARWGSYVAPGVVLMPCFINIGAFVDEGTMVDTWATVGSCAQIGRHCHLSGGVGIGGVLEPLQAAPVIIEDGVFIGARSEVAEGAIVEEGAVLAMGCYLGATTKIFNALTGEVTHGRIPRRAVVVPGSLPARDGSHATYALIIKKYRDERTDARTALNALLR